MARAKQECDFDLPTTKLGHSTQRIAAALGLDGRLPAARGLKASLGWQRITQSDLDKTTAAGPKLAALSRCSRLDPDTVFVEAEDQDGVNTVQRTIFDVALRYDVFDDAFLAADFTSRRIDTGSVKLFETCSSYSSGRCSSQDNARHNKLSQDAMTLGGGVNLAQGLTLTFEYSKVAYDRTYAQFAYSDVEERTSDTTEFFNGRLAYDWQ